MFIYLICYFLLCNVLRVIHSTLLYINIDAFTMHISRLYINIYIYLLFQYTDIIHFIIICIYMLLVYLLIYFINVFHVTIDILLLYYTVHVLLLFLTHCYLLLFLCIFTFIIFRLFNMICVYVVHCKRFRFFLLSEYVTCLYFQYLRVVKCLHY